MLEGLSPVSVFFALSLESLIYKSNFNPQIKCIPITKAEKQVRINAHAHHLWHIQYFGDYSPKSSQ